MENQKIFTQPLAKMNKDSDTLSHLWMMRLANGAKLQPGDEVRWNGKWQKISSSCEKATVTRGIQYRRPLSFQPPKSSADPIIQAVIKECDLDNLPLEELENIYQRERDITGRIAAEASSLLHKLRCQIAKRKGGLNYLLGRFFYWRRLEAQDCLIRFLKDKHGRISSLAIWKNSSGIFHLEVSTVPFDLPREMDDLEEITQQEYVEAVQRITGQPFTDGGLTFNFSSLQCDN